MATSGYFPPVVITKFVCICSIFIFGLVTFSITDAIGDDQSMRVNDDPGRLALGGNRDGGDSRRGNEALQRQTPAGNPDGARDTDAGEAQGENRNSGLSNQQNRPSAQVKNTLASDAACLEDVQKYCKAGTKNNLAVLDCLQNDLKDGETVSSACQHVLWSYKHKLTTDLHFETAAGEICEKELDQFPDCKTLDQGKGLVIPCLIDNIEKIQNVGCKKLLSKMELIVFSDYKLIYKLVEKCRLDIQKTKCGRLDDDSQEGKDKPLPHGETVECLGKKINELEPECKTEVLHLAELQADDFNKDRSLWFACRNDRERLCADVRAGNGQVYQCLFKHKFDADMSDQCKERLTARQKLQNEDFKVNRGLWFACKDDIKNNYCTLQQEHLDESKQTKMSVILLCLERVTTARRRLAPECVAQLKDVRRSLMSDYQLNPEIVVGCTEEIKECNNEGSMKQGGATLHCLMDKARAKIKSKEPIRTACRKAMIGLLKEINIREDVSIDPVLQEACSSIIQLKCEDVPAGDGKVIDCLMDHIDHAQVMNSECKERLMEIQYFVSRDFTLSVSFYRSCEPEMKTVCHEDISASLDSSNQSAILLCLYRAGKEGKVSKNCLRETRKVMLDRAKSVDLEPDVEDACKLDLGQYCSEKTDKDDEMDCLEDNLDKLSEDCKKVVARYVEEEDEDPELREMFLEQCADVIKKHCQDALDTGKDDDDDTLMQCLIKHKNVEEMNRKCRSHITHHQIITLTDWKLSHEFKEACRESIEDHCPDEKEKSKVVECLSEIIRDDTINEKRPPRIEKGCRKQLKFELLQRSENIKLDPDLQVACSIDVQKFCSKEVSSDEGRAVVITCLRQNQKSLSLQCHELIFKREVQEAADPSTDFMLMTKCKKMIKKYCLDSMSSPNSIFSCLVQKQEEEEFDKDCKTVVRARVRLRATDYRLNPELAKNCRDDINKFCGAALKAAVDSHIETEGKVLYCLRRVFASKGLYDRKLRDPESGSKGLSPACYQHVGEVIKESIMSHVQDRDLVDACHKEIVGNCLAATTVDKNELGDRNEVVDCLRNVLKATSSKNTACLLEIRRILSENRADVHLDPLLYRACAVDIQHNCKDIPRGEGRQMSCLLDLHSDNSVKLRPECNKALSDRVKLWELSIKLAPPESLSEVFSQVADSNSRNYLFGVMFAIIGVIFIGGLFCGRVTKRVARQAKNR